MTGQTKDYRIPKRFVDDHDSRDCLRDDTGKYTNKGDNK